MVHVLVVILTRFCLFSPFLSKKFKINFAKTFPVRDEDPKQAACWYASSKPRRSYRILRSIVSKYLMIKQICSVVPLSVVSSNIKPYGPFPSLFLILSLIKSEKIFMALFCTFRTGVSGIFWTMA